MRRTKIKIGNRIIGEDESIFITAEAGINHDGKIKQAERLIIEAAKAGCDAVKFQSFKADRLLRKSDPFYELFKGLELSEKDHQHLFKVAGNEGIIFLSTPFDEESAQMLEGLGVVAFKVASGDITHLPFLEYLAKLKKPIILSTGMATLSEVEEALAIIKKAGNDQVILLHCLSNYPASIEKLNLRVISTLKQTFGLPVGFSDHTIGLTASIVATALGAVVIEKHFTLDKTLPGPDHRLSLEPQEMKRMVEELKLIQTSLGDGIKKIIPEEQEIRNLARRSIVAKRDLSQGEVITDEVLDYLRPGNGLPPVMARFLVGRILKHELHKGETIKLEDLQ